MAENFKSDEGKRYSGIESTKSPKQDEFKEIHMKKYHN